MAKNMPTADNARHLSRPAQGKATGPLRKAVRSFDTSIPHFVKGGKSGTAKGTARKTLPKI